MKQQTFQLVICAFVGSALLGSCQSGRRQFDLDYHDGTWIVDSVDVPEYKRLKLTFNVFDEQVGWHRSLRLHLPVPPTRIAGNPPGEDAPSVLHSPAHEIGPSAAQVVIRFPATDETDFAEVRVELSWRRPETDIASDSHYIQNTRVAMYEKSDIDDFILDVKTLHEQTERRERFDNYVPPIQVIVHTDSDIQRLAIRDLNFLKDFATEAWNRGTDDPDSDL